MESQTVVVLAVLAVVLSAVNQVCLVIALLSWRKEKGILSLAEALAGFLHLSQQSERRIVLTNEEEIKREQAARGPTVLDDIEEMEREEAVKDDAWNAAFDQPNTATKRAGAGPPPPLPT